MPKFIVKNRKEEIQEYEKRAELEQLLEDLGQKKAVPEGEE